MNIENSTNLNASNAINNQIAFYDRTTNLVNRKFEFPTVNLLFAESMLISNNVSRANFFEIPGPWGSTPSFSGIAGSPTVGVIQNPQKIG